MSISLPISRCEKSFKMSKKILKVKKCKIREFAELIGFLISCCPTLEHGFFHRKILEQKKYLALKKPDDDYGEKMILSDSVYSVYSELQWWLKNSFNTEKSLKPRKFSIEIFLDASLSGWGVACIIRRAHGFWDADERQLPITALELKAAFFALKCFANEKRNADILLCIDNTVAISYINRMGGFKFKNLNKITHDIWSWRKERKIWIFTSYISFYFYYFLENVFLLCVSPIRNYS